MANITIYSKGYCPFCKLAKSTLRDLGLQFNELDITDNARLTAQMQTRSGRSTVPQIFINGRHLGGNDDLQASLHNGQLRKLLQTEAA